MPKPPAYLHFDNMTWPHPHDPLEVEWSLRYGTPSREQMRTAASIIAAYRELVDEPVRRRNEKIAGLRRAIQEVTDAAG